MEFHAKNSDALVELALAAKEQGKVQRAEALFLQALQQDSHNPDILKNLGMVMLDTGRYQNAVEYLQKSISIQPDDAKVHNGLGIAFQNINFLEESENAYKTAIQLKPDYEAAYSNLVSVLERRNRMEEARQYVDQAKALFPGGILITLNEAIVLKREGRLEEAVQLLKTEKYPQDPMTRLKVKHELGLMYDRLDNVDKAFEQFRDFNACASEVFGISRQRKAPYLNKIERFREVFTPEWVSSWKRQNSEKPVRNMACLMGFMRSGTTLLQHILNAHPAIYASEEIHAFPIVEEEIRKTFDAYPECMADFGGEQIEHFRQRYFEIHRGDRNWQEAGLFVDKYPMLTNMAGLVHRLFPEEKFIFIKRHPCDCILSAYMQLFVPNEASVHFYNLDDTVNLYTGIMDLWEVYENTLPLNVHYVRYEDIIEDFESSVRGVLDFLDVPWDDAVLDYDQKVRRSSDVISPSYEQVSEKIYKHARYRWVRYRPYLEPYLERLKPYAERFGY